MKSKFISLITILICMFMLFASVITVSAEQAANENETSAESAKDLSTASEKDTIKPLQVFTEEDKIAAEKLPEELTSEHYKMVIKLFNKLIESKKFIGMEKYYINLTKAMNTVSNIEYQIANLNTIIRDYLYPFKDFKLRDRDLIYEVVDSYEKLSSYDESKIYRYDYVLKAKEEINSSIKTILIIVICTTVAVPVLYFVYLNIKKKKINIAE